MDELALRWEKAKLPPVFYHTSFMENVPLILIGQKIIANKGRSICEEKMGWSHYLIEYLKES